MVRIMRSNFTKSVIVVRRSESWWRKSIYCWLYSLIGRKKAEEEEQEEKTEIQGEKEEKEVKKEKKEEEEEK